MASETVLAVAVEDAATATIVCVGAAHIGMELGAGRIVVVHALESHSVAGALSVGASVSVPAAMHPVHESADEAREVLVAGEAALRSEYAALERRVPAITTTLTDGTSHSQAIARAATEAGARAIVVGARRPHAFGRLTHPDVRAALGRYTTLPIYVVPLDAHGHAASDASVIEATSAAPVAEPGTVVTASIELEPDEVDALLMRWPEIRATALSRASCRDFRLLRDRNHNHHWMIVSEWDNASDFDGFMRTSGVQWLSRQRSRENENAYSYFDVVSGPVSPEDDAAEGPRRGASEAG